MTEENERIVKRYTVRVSQQGSDGRNYWQTIGSAWPNEKTGGISVKMVAVPVSGEFMLFPVEPSNESNKGGAGRQTGKGK